MNLIVEDRFCFLGFNYIEILKVKEYNYYFVKFLVIDLF